MYCPECGTPSARARYCWRCGALLPAGVPAPVAATSPAPTEAPAGQTSAATTSSRGSLVLVLACAVVLVAMLAGGVVLLSSHNTGPHRAAAGPEPVVSKSTTAPSAPAPAAVKRTSHAPAASKVDRQLARLARLAQRARVREPVDLRSFPLTLRQSTWDPGRTEYSTPPVTSAPYVHEDVCGVWLRPDVPVRHVSSIGVGAELFDNDQRELFVFETGAAAADYVQSVRAAVQACPHDPYETGLDYTLIAPLTRHDEVMFVESAPHEKSPLASVGLVHVMRVGSGVLFQVKGAPNTPAGAREMLAWMTRLSAELGRSMCGFTSAGCPA